MTGHRRAVAVVSTLMVVAGSFMLLARLARRDRPVAPCPTVIGASPAPSAVPAPPTGRCPLVAITVLPTPTVVTTVVTVEPPGMEVVRERGTTTVIVSPGPPGPTRTVTASPRPAPSRTPTPSRTPSPCPLPTLPVIGCPPGRTSGPGAERPTG